MNSKKIVCKSMEMKLPILFNCTKDILEFVNSVEF